MTWDCFRCGTANPSNQDDCGYCKEKRDLHRESANRRAAELSGGEVYEGEWGAEDVLRREG